MQRISYLEKPWLAGWPSPACFHTFALPPSSIQVINVHQRSTMPPQGMFHRSYSKSYNCSFLSLLVVTVITQLESMLTKSLHITRTYLNGHFFNMYPSIRFLQYSRNIKIKSLLIGYYGPIGRYLQLWSLCLLQTMPNQQEWKSGTSRRCGKS